ncbi:MAG TPA: shikimate dehydrogenase [Abditibacteriaceae bacterium]
MNFSAHTKTIAIIGDPIEHSITPRVQNAALREIDADIVNVAFRVAPHNLREAVAGARALGFLGLMVTIPHKEAVLELCDALDESARIMGAANLLHFGEETVGYSSDGWAALKSLEEENVVVQDARILILGGGGAARSLALTFALAGARSVGIANRTVTRAETIAEETRALGVKAFALSNDEAALRTQLDTTDILVNATSVGMHPNIDETPVACELLHPKLAVYDIVYNPLETRLLREAREVGARAVDGLGMLLYTNVRAVEVCAGLDISAATMRREALAALAR